MQALGLLLLLINIGAVVAPVAAVAVIYQNNLLEIVVPSEAQNVVSSAIESGDTLKLPEYESYTYDREARIASVTFKFTNPLDLDLTVNSVSADVKCLDHGLALGTAALKDRVQLNAKATVTMTVVFSWTQAAEEHFIAKHANESKIKIELVNLVLDVSGITIETPESIELTVPMTL